MQEAVRLDGARRLSLGAVPVPEPRDGEVLVRVAYAGICGSDLHVYETGAYVPYFPVTPGHEVSGYVEAVGPGGADLQPGLPVVLDSRVPCGACDWCAAGEPQRCRQIGFLGEVRDGGFAPFVVVPRRAIYPLPPGLPLDVSALAEPCAVALHGIRHALHTTRSPDTALVIGLGPLGALAALVLRLHGLRVAGVEADACRRATVAGATDLAIYDPSGVPAEPFDLVVDCAGFGGSLASCLGRVRSGGTVLALALHRAAETLDANMVVERELTLCGAHVFRDEMADAIALLAERPELFAPLITARIPLSDVPDMFGALLAGGSGQIKVLVAPGCGQGGAGVQPPRDNHPHLLL